MNVPNLKIPTKSLNFKYSTLTCPPISLRAEESNEKSQTAFDIPHEYLSLDNTIEHDEHVESTRVNIVGYEESISNEEIPNCINPSENMTTQLANYKLRQQQKYEQENTVTNNFDTSLNNEYESDDTFETSSSTFIHNLYPWENHSTGVASKILKMILK